MAIRIDVDSHFFPKDVFDDVDPRFGDRRPRVWFDAVGRSRITYPEREANMSPHQRALPNLLRFSRQRPGFWDPEVRIEFLDRVGVDMQVLVPSNESFHYDVDADLATSVCQSYNNAIARVLDRYPGRFIGLAHLPMQAPTAAVRELERAVRELGIHAPTLFTNVNGRNLDEPEFWPVYAKAEELDVPIILHPSRSGKLLGLERLTKYHLDNALGFLYEGSLAITSFITGGVLDLFPTLRIALMETGCGYLPYLMDRLNEVYDQEGVDELIKHRPPEYLRHFWLAANVTTEKETMAYVVERYGADRLMMAIDFPHGLGGAGEACVDDVVANPRLTDAQKDRILGLNAAELFGIDPVTKTQARGRSATVGA
ncbi:MAG TPA: amidohydrolase family protein [Chloroflexota bacterium]|nr:amidohydrolase family protein [Chloroflexota bacterium]